MTLDLGSATRTIAKLIEKELFEAGGLTVKTTAAPPDLVPNEDNTVSVYLYHLMETPEARNLPPARGTGPVPVQHAPMGVVLEYIITIVHTANSDAGVNTLVEQKLLGAVARTLHDFPIITDKTTIGGELILDPELRGQDNPLKLILRPALKEETIGFWNSEQTKVARLSLFLEARVLLLEPKPPVTLPGIVLSVGQFIFPGLGPELADSRNAIAFRPPGRAAFVSVTASPARVALFPVADPAVPADIDDPVVLDNALVTFDGSGLRPGNAILLLRRGDFSIRVPIDASLPQNAAWQFDLQPSALRFRFRRQVRGLLGQSENLTTTSLVPGIYSARLTLLEERLRGMPRASNELVFSVTPQIGRVEATTTANTYSLTILSDYLADTGIEVELSIAGAILRQVGAPGGPTTLGPGAFQVTGGSTVRFMLPDSLLPPAPPPAPDHPLAVQLLVNGATATPAWLTEAAP